MDAKIKNRLFKYCIGFLSGIIVYILINLILNLGYSTQYLILGLEIGILSGGLGLLLNIFLFENTNKNKK